MRFFIDVQNALDFPVDSASLVAAAEAVLRAHSRDMGDGAMTVVITDDAAAAALNRQFRGVDAATDVLSFPADAPPIVILGEPIYQGDLVIAYPYAKAQAEREGLSFLQSLRLLVVHGTLHLLGYDHDTLEARATMWAAQDTILTQLDIPLSIVPPLEALD